MPLFFAEGGEVVRRPGAGQLEAEAERRVLFGHAFGLRAEAVELRARDEEGETPLRNGAWYPVLSSGVTRAVLDVSGQRVTVAQDMLEVRDKRPDRFTVVYRTHDDPNPARGTRADVGRRYGVCPRCATRVPFRGGVIPSHATCNKCKHEGIVAWWETG